MNDPERFHMGIVDVVNDYSSSIAVNGLTFRKRDGICNRLEPRSLWTISVLIPRLPRQHPKESKKPVRAA